MAYQEFNQPLYLEGTEAFANHNLLNDSLFPTSNGIDMDIGTFLQDENNSWSTQAQVHDHSALNGGPPRTLEPQVSGNTFNSSAAQLFAEQTPVYPDPTALEPSLPYYGNYAPLNNVIQPNPQLQNPLRQSFIPPRPLIQYGSQFFQNTQTDLDSRVARDEEEVELLRAHRLRKTQQSDQPAVPSRQTSPRPTVTDSTPFISPASSPTFGEVSRVSWNRSQIRVKDPKCDPKNFYPELPKLKGWCLNANGQPRIKYTESGQWVEQLTFTKDQVLYYLENCPRKFRLWVQSVPSQSNHRINDPCDRKCRYKSCPMPGRSMVPGWFRVAFDEFPELTCKGKRDPFKIAGSMHLWCFEQIIDPAVLYRRGILKHDDRTFLREDRNPMSLARDSADRLIVDEAFKPWMDARKEEARVQFPRPHSESLSCCLTLYHLAHQTNTRQAARNKRNAKRRGCEHKTVEVHKGDIMVYVRALRLSKNNAEIYEDEDEDEDEDEEEEETEPEASLPEEVQAAPAPNPPTPPAESHSLDNSCTDFLLQSIDLTVPTTDFTTSMAIDPLANPHFGSLDSLSAFDGFSFDDFANGFIDPSLQAPYEPLVKEEVKPVDEDDSAKVDGIMTPRSLSHVEDYVDVQKDNAPASACSELGSLFGSPTVSKPSSPKAKSPIKKRKRDDDDEYSPTNPSKRTRSQTSASSEGRRRSSTRSLRSCRKSP